MYHIVSRLYFNVITFFSLLLLAACGSELQTTAVFNTTNDIEKGDPVYLENQMVGEVARVKQESVTTEIVIEMNELGQQQVKQDAAIVMNRLKTNSPLEIYNKKSATADIAHESQLTALNSMLELGTWMVGDTIAIGGNSLSGYVDAFQRYLDGDKFQQDKQVLQDAAKQIGSEVQGMTATLEQELEKLTKELGLTEEKAAAVIEQFGGELAPVIGELSKSSQAVVQELEKFTENIQFQNEEGKELGSTILSSLLKTLETVNESLEPLDPALDEQDHNETFEKIDPNAPSAEPQSSMQ